MLCKFDSCPGHAWWFLCRCLMYCPGGGIGRHASLRGWWLLKVVQVRVLFWAPCGKLCFFWRNFFLSKEFLFCCNCDVRPWVFKTAQTRKVVVLEKSNLLWDFLLPCKNISVFYFVVYVYSAVVLPFTELPDVIRCLCFLLNSEKHKVHKLLLNPPFSLGGIT